MDVRSYFEDWLVLRRPELKPRTLESYRDLLDRYILPSIGEVDLNALTGDQIRHLLAGIVAAGHTRTAELVYVLLRCAFSDLEHSPMARVRRPRHYQKHPEPWTDDQAAMYVAACLVHPHGLSLLLAISLGMRRGEICGLRWRDVDFDAQQIHIVNQRVRLESGEIVDCSPKSRASVRTVPIPADLAPLLRAARGHPDAYVCKLTPSGLSQAHAALVARLALPRIGLHGLRHTFATSSMRHCGDVRALQATLGHSSYSVTLNIYTHPDREMLSRAIDAPISRWYNVLRPKSSVSS